MARRSVALNGLVKKNQIVQGDIREAGTLFGAASLTLLDVIPRI